MSSAMSAPVRFARGTVVQLLKRLTGGSIRLVDRFGEERFGECDAPAPRDARPIDVTVHVHDPRTYTRVLRAGSVGLGDTYADGWWDTDDLTGLLRVALRSQARSHAAGDRVYR